MKRIIKTILKKILRPVLSRYQIMERFDKLDKLEAAIMSVLSVCNPITESPPAHGTLRKIQLAKTNVLFAFDQFCKEKGLRYWLYSGTLLGAVRHNGFIPWDDDIDICMIREDFDKFVKIISSMPQNGKIQYFWKGSLLKIKYIDNDFILDAVDLFPFYQYHKRTNAAEVNQLKILIDKQIKHKYYEIPLLEMPYSDILSIPKIIREIIMQGKNPAEDGDIFRVGYYKEFFRYEWIFPLSTMIFEGKQLSAPNNPNNILESQYGDFLMYPPDIYNAHGSISDDIKNNWRNYEKLDGFLSMDSNAIYKIMIGEKI